MNMAPWEGIEQYRRKTLFVKLTKQIRRIQKDVNFNRAMAQGRLAAFDTKIRGLLDQHGVYSDLRHQYMAYARALDKTQRDMDFMVDLIREHQILRDRFERRDLEASILDLIDRFVIYRTANR